MDNENELAEAGGDWGGGPWTAFARVNDTDSWWAQPNVAMLLFARVRAFGQWRWRRRPSLPHIATQVDGMFDIKSDRQDVDTAPRRLRGSQPVFCLLNYCVRRTWDVLSSVCVSTDKLLLECDFTKWRKVGWQFIIDIEYNISLIL